LLAVAVLALAVFSLMAGCEDTLMLRTVRGLVLTGKWDEGTYDSSIFGE